MATMLPPGYGAFVDQAPQNILKRDKESRRKKVTWAAGDKLSQVRLFAADDAPCLSGIARQDALQIKQTRFMHSATPISSFDELDLPPGFGDSVIKHVHVKMQASDFVAQTPWRCPVKYILTPSWQVVAGEESEDADIQRQRELVVPPAIYSFATSIPDSSAEPQEPQLPYDESMVPQIPVVPVEDEESIEVDGGEDLNADGDSREHVVNGEQVAIASRTTMKDESDTPFKLVAGGSPTVNLSNALNSQTTVNIEPDVVVAAAAAFAAMGKAKQQGNLIDHDLLIQILSNPALVEVLTGAKPRVLSAKCSSGTPFVGVPKESQPNRSVPLSIKPIHINTNEQSNPTISPSPPPGFGITNIETKQAFDNGDGLLLNPGMDNTILEKSSGSFSSNTDLNMLQSNGNINYPFLQSNVHQAMMGLEENRQPTNHQQLQPSCSAPFMNLSGRSSQYDEQYCKSLIMQHGGNHNDKPSCWKINTIPTAEVERDRLGICTGDTSRLKSRKVCAYYNTPKGCRRGISCTFFHDTSQDGVAVERLGFGESQLHLSKKIRYENFT